MLDTPSYIRKILHVQMLLTAVPYALTLLLLSIYPSHHILFGSYSTLLDQSTEIGLAGLLVQIVTTLWIFTSPLWFLCTFYLVTQKNKFHHEALIWSLIGGVGNCICIALVFVF